MQQQGPALHVPVDAAVPVRAAAGVACDPVVAGRAQTCAAGRRPAVGASEKWGRGHLGAGNTQAPSGARE